MDLATATTRQIELQDKTPLVISRFIAGGKVVFAEFRVFNDVDRKVVFCISGDGSVRRMQFRQFVSFHSDGRPAPISHDLLPLLAGRQLAGLTELQKTLCRAGQAFGVSRVHDFHNDEFFVTTNVDGMISRLGENTIGQSAEPCQTTGDLNRSDLEIRLERAAVKDLHRSDEDARILRLHLIARGNKWKTFDFGSGPDFFYRATLLGDRLFLVGNGVKFLDLSARGPLSASTGRY